MKHSFYLFILLCSVSLILALSLNPYGFCVGVTSRFNGHDILSTYFLFSFDGGVKDIFGFCPVVFIRAQFLARLTFRVRILFLGVFILFALVRAKRALFSRNIFWSFPVRASRVFFISGSYP